MRIGVVAVAVPGLDPSYCKQWSIEMAVYNALAFSGGTHHCFAFWTKFEDCSMGETEPLAMCRESFEDYMECFKRKKENRLNARVNQELHKWRILALPQYNELTDSFEPTRIPVDPDAYFK